ncbi:MAG: glycogen/starch/alpha-glucan phosphorylase [Deltaproteobacteria bacterium]|nr:glycogen/starch/alpha-glucan phosphorylase [Deltaproteobacteria bacterium]
MPLTLKDITSNLMDSLIYGLAKDLYSATQRDKYEATVLTVRRYLTENWIRTQQKYYHVDAKRVYYLSMEFLLGRLLRNYIINLNLPPEFKHAVEVFGLTLEDILEQEWDAGLGHGGLGRLAACFLDSLATLKYPAYGYGIRYEYGIFVQNIKDGYQVESPDSWLRYGNPWEFPRPENLYLIKFYGKVRTITNGGARFRKEWVDAEEVMAMAYDYPIPGYHNDVVNTLRLWAAKSTRDFNLDYFNSGDYVKAMEDKSLSENISKVLYPNDQSIAGKELRLKQEYFFVSATLKDIIRRYKKTHRTYLAFPEKVAIQLNDTHPSIGIAELIRILVDEENLPWEKAFEITKKTFAYTNHTVLPEALEIWPEEILGRLLPRHLEIIKEIDRRFLIQVKETYSNDEIKLRKMSIVQDFNGKRVINMAHLALVGSHTINGVSELHTQILKKKVFGEFYEMMPEKFLNITNGVTHRRWLLESNPELSALITEAIGDGWIKNFEEIRKLEQFAEDDEFQVEFSKVKRENKEKLRIFLEKSYGISISTDAFLDCQIKRFHEYKRQLLNILHVITLFNRIMEGRFENQERRIFLFSGKSAPGYFICKLIIKLINNVSLAIDSVQWARERIKVVFVPNYSVTHAQKIIPAADLSEQISTAGYEASGTGNMKFAMNGAITIGTLDGANVEIREAVGEENFFTFGHSVEQLDVIRKNYNPYEYYEKNEELKKAIDQIRDGYFSPENRTLFRPIVEALLRSDEYFVLLDYESYVSCQERVSLTYANQFLWNKMAILNIARCGKFSSDRAVREYAEKVWKVKPID